MSRLITATAAGVMIAALAAVPAAAQDTRQAEGGAVGGSFAASGGALAEPAESGEQPTAISYDPQNAPVGAHLAVTSVARSTPQTTVTLVARGLLPDREYGAHVHENPCGPDGDDAGSHYQNIQDPVSPSTDPAYANSANEFWLDFHTDPLGNGYATTTVDFDFTDRVPGSVVLHERHTSIGHGQAGTAGSRLACITVPF